MEAQVEGMGSKDYTQIIKGKRTKRQRTSSPLALTMASSSSSGNGGGGGSGSISDNSGGYDRRDGVTASPTNSIEFTGNTEEEEDMANCLILLAQGRQTRKLSDPVVATTNKAGAGLFVYQCKTCNRCFPSFQALGGHRASHKKLIKAAAGEDKKPPPLLPEEQDRFANNTTTILSLQIPNRVLSSSRVHECSICGAEFTSGQALGGHMRRHRTGAESQEAKKPRSSILSLDLNLPAPEDDHRESKLIPFASNGQVIVFSPASPLVDCHY